MKPINYESPLVEIVCLQDEAVLCQSSGKFTGGNETYIEEDLN